MTNTVYSVSIGQLARSGQSADVTKTLDVRLRGATVAYVKKDKGGMYTIGLQGLGEVHGYEGWMCTVEIDGQPDAWQVDALARGGFRKVF